MLKQMTDIRASLQGLELSNDEIEIYLALIHAPATPLALSQKTGVKRTKIYSLLDALERRGLIVKISKDGKSLFNAANPSNLGIRLNELAAQLQEQQGIFNQLVPMLSALQGVGQTNRFIIRTHEGEEGFKQMLWHELKAKGELLSLGGGDVEELVTSPAWSSQYRERVVAARYQVREIINSEIDLPSPIQNQDYLHRYHCRGISARTIPLENQTTIYNDTVAIYNWRQKEKAGIEIVCKPFADTMRAVFDCFWKITEPAS